MIQALMTLVLMTLALMTGHNMTNTMRKLFEKLASFKAEDYCHFIISMLIIQIGIKVLMFLGAAQAIAIWLSLLAACTAGLSKEFADSKVPGDKFDSRDLLADAIGIAVGLALSLI